MLDLNKKTITIKGVIYLYDEESPIDIGDWFVYIDDVPEDRFDNLIAKRFSKEDYPDIYLSPFNEEFIRGLTIYRNELFFKFKKCKKIILSTKPLDFFKNGSLA